MKVFWNDFDLIDPTPVMKHMSNEAKPGWLGYIGDEILPSYVRILFINRYEDPY